MIEVRISYKVKRDLEEAVFASKCNLQENWFDINNRWVSFLNAYLILDYSSMYLSNYFSYQISQT